MEVLIEFYLKGQERNQDAFREQSPGRWAWHGEGWGLHPPGQLAHLRSST